MNDFIISLEKMLAEPSRQNIEIEKRLSGLILFSKRKVFVFGQKGKPEQNLIHAIVDRINQMVVGLFFSSDEYVIFDEFRRNILYRLHRIF